MSPCTPVCIIRVSSETPCIRRSKRRSGPQSRSTPPPRRTAVSNPQYGGNGTNDSGVAFYHRSSIADKMSDYEDIWYDTLPRDGYNEKDHLKYVIVDFESFM